MSRNVERKIGIGTYLGDVPALGGRLRKEIQDFIVVERFARPPEDHNGRYSIATVRVRNWEMNRLVRKLSLALRIDRRSIGFAGTKDKRAITTQLMSFPVPPNALRELDLGDVQILDVYRSGKSISIGELMGNHFDIVISEVKLSEEECADILERNMALFRRTGGFLNYFGIQRFGAIRTVTHIVGDRIVKRDFRGAVMAYVGEPVEDEPEDVIEARRMAEETEDWRGVLDIFPKNYTFERTMIGHLSRHPEDYIGALRRLPKNLLLMFVHAYQSRFFNEMITRRIEKGIPADGARPGDVVISLGRDRTPNRRRYIPVTDDNVEKVRKRIKEGKAFVTALLVGTEAELAGGEQGKIEREILDREGIEKKAFFIPELPGLSSKGIRREIIAPARDVTYDIRRDSVRLRFDLFKGCYATSFLREIMKVEDVTKY